MGWLCGRSLRGFGRLVGFALLHCNVIIHPLYLLVNSKCKKNSRLNTNLFRNAAGRVLLWSFRSVRNGPGAGDALWGISRTRTRPSKPLSVRKNKKGEFAKTY